MTNPFHHLTTEQLEVLSEALSAAVGLYPFSTADDAIASDMLDEIHTLLDQQSGAPTTKETP